MGELEKRAAKRRTRENVQGAVLSAVATAGLLAVAIAIPNTLQAFPSLIGKRRYKLAFQTRTAIERLIAKGHLKRSGSFLELTELGRRQIQIAEASSTKVARKKRRWDGQYRLVMFDIPQTKRTTRERLRRLMQSFGFLRLQDSVWVSPYDCEELIALVKRELKIGKEVIYAVVREIENDGFIRTHFDLKK